MKHLLPTIVLLSTAVFPTQAQTSQPQAASPVTLALAATLSQPTAYKPVDRGRDHTTWERYRSETNRSGRVIIHTNRYVALETGKHFSQNGQWLDTREEVAIVPGGAMATNGPHKVGFAANINSRVPVAVRTPGNTTLKIRPLGLAYYDYHAETNVIIAELKDSAGLVVGTNQVLYRDAFTEFRVDVRYTYKQSGCEQDIILIQRPPLPESFGLNPNSTRLLVLTEFIDPPADVQITRQVRRGWKLATVDKVIKLAGLYKIMRGKGGPEAVESAWADDSGCMT